MSGTGARIRPAGPADAGLLFEMTLELARYEGLEALVSATPERLVRVLSAQPPGAFYDIAELDGQPAGFVAWFQSYSTFEGRPGLFVEDVYVREPFRRRGLARRMYANLAKHCVQQRLSRLEWRVLAWNSPAIAFFRSLSVPVNDEWRFGRMTAAGIQGLAAESC